MAILGWFCLGLSLLGWTLAVLIPFYSVLMHGEIASRFFDPVALSVVWATAKQALISTLIASSLGLVLGLWFGGLAATRGRRRVHLVEGLLALPFGIPTVVVGLAWVLWLGRAGIFSRWGVPFWLTGNLIYSLSGVILAHVFLNLPWVALLVSQARMVVPSSELDAVQSLGAGRWDVFRFVIFPRIRRAWLSATVQVFSLCSMSFALVLLLGGGPPVETLETALFSRIRYGTVDVEGAVVFAVWELILTLIPWIALLVLDPVTLKEIPIRIHKSTSRTSAPMRSIFSWVGVVTVGLILVLPYFALVNPHALGLLWRDTETRMEILRALVLSLQLAFATATATVAAVLIAFGGASVLAGKKGASALYFAILCLPSGISVLVLGLGYWLAYGNWVDPFAGSFRAMVALQTTVFFPVGLRILWPLLQESRKNLMDAAQLMGASITQAFWAVEWPRWRPVIFSAFAVVAAASLGEIAAVSLFYSENLIPLPLVISRWMAQYRFDEGQAAAALLFLVSGGVTLSVFMGRSWVERSNR